MTAVVSYATLFPIATWVNTAPPDPLLPIIQAKSLGIWGVISGAVSLVIMYLNYRFYGKHNGIDLRAVSYTHLGSTVTQQLAKNMYFTQEKELQRKVAEVFVAFDLEQNYSKNEILELYVNTIYYGNGYYCVKDASEGYFGKAPNDMTDYESTLLAGIPNAPSKYAPTVSPELAQKRQEQVLARLVKCGYFTEERALETLAAGNVL